MSSDEGGPGLSVASGGRAGRPSRRHACATVATHCIGSLLRCTFSIQSPYQEMETITSFLTKLVITLVMN